MTTSSDDSIFGILTQQVFLPTGSSQPVLIDGNAIAGANSLILKAQAGGTMYILGVAAGVTLSAAQGVTAVASGYLLDVAEKLSYGGAPRFYATALGATGTLYLQWGRSSGN